MSVHTHTKKMVVLQALDHTDSTATGNLVAEPFGKNAVSLTLISESGKLMNVDLDELEEMIQKARTLCAEERYA